jgi:hypothetical protein
MTKEKNTPVEIVDPLIPVVKSEKPSADSVENIEGLRTVASQALDAAKVALDAYWRLCVFIREKQLTPVTVNKVLKELGYGEVRISEIKRVSFSSDKIFEEFRKKTIGFRLALKEARKVARGPVQVTSEEVLFAEAMGRLVQEFVPLKGKLPFWLKSFEMEAQGAVVTFTAVRKTTIAVNTRKNDQG